MPHAFETLLIASAALAGAGAVLIARLRERHASERFRRATVATLYDHARRAVRRPVPSSPDRPAALAEALHRHLAAFPDPELVRLGDEALASKHPFAQASFDVIYQILADRRAAAADRLRRRAAWPDLRRLSPGDVSL